MANKKNRKQRRPTLKKTGTRSPYFQSPSADPKKQPYFTVPRKGHGVKMKGRTKSKGGITVFEGNKEEESLGYNGSFEVAVVTEKSFVERTGDYQDGWMSEAESKNSEDRPARKKGEKERRKNKMDSHKRTNLGLRGVKTENYFGKKPKEWTQNPKPEDYFGDAGFAVVIEYRKTDSNPNNVKTERKRKRGNREKVTIPIRQTNSFAEGPAQSKKRKRGTKLEAPTAGLLAPPTLSHNNSELIRTHPERYDKKTGGDLQSWIETGSFMPVEEETLEERISRYWTERYEGGVDGRGKIEISTHKSPLPQVIDRGSGNKLQIPEIVASILPLQNNPIIFSAYEKPCSTNPQKKATPAFLSQNTPQKIPPVSDTIVEPFADIVPVSTTKTSAVTPRRSIKHRTKKTGTISKYFASSATEPPPPKRVARKKRVPAGTSVIPWPPLTADNFGLIQEELRNNTFHVIISTIFLNKTRGSVAVPLLRQFLIDYPTPQILSQGDYDTITKFLQPLGLHRTRAKRLIEMAKVWIANPPTPGKGFKKYNYPARDTKPFNIPLLSNDPEKPKLGVEQGCEWEIAHLPGVGAYALDSWRIFCRDDFREGIVNIDNRSFGQEEEWRRVVPKDKELRACLRWRWAKEGLRWREAGDMEVEIEAEGGIGTGVLSQGYRDVADVMECG